MEIETATAKLTAYNEDIQRYIERPNKAAKDAIISEVKEDLLRKGINFNRLFPAGSKRARVFDEVIYLLSVGGICKVSADRLASNIGSSVKTVSDAVKYIKQTDSFIVGGLADGKNKYVFVYKKHADFNEIMASVFYVNAEHVAEHVAEQPSAENTDMTATDSEKSDSISNIFNISKQEKDILRASIEKEVIESQGNPQKEKVAAHEYLTNTYQKRLYTSIKYDSTIHGNIKASSLVIALRAGSNLDENGYNKALVAVRKIDRYLYFDGEIRQSVPALFDRLYRDLLAQGDADRARQEARRRTLLKYDWITV